MKLYKGEQLNNKKINWTNPEDLPENPQLKELEKGKQLFISNCASCHAIGRDLTAPNLAHMVKRSKMIAKKEGHNYLYEFTRNWNKVYSKSKYYREITCWSPSVMNLFEPFSDKELDNLYGYIENESELNNLPIPVNYLDECIDSCRKYERIKDSLQGIRTQLEKDSVPMVIEKRESFVILPTTSPVISAPALVEPLTFKSLYYQFTIESFGWYNIDILLKEETHCIPSNLTVSMKGQYSERANLYLIIPSLKALLPGGLLTNQKTTYGFYEKDGSIPLPSETKAYIIAIGDYEDKIVFSEQQFITSRKQSIEIELAFIEKEVFNKKMNSLSFDGLSLLVAGTKKADSLRKVVKDLKEVEMLKPKGCDCNCGKQSLPSTAKNNINDEQAILNTK
ncbi:MAG: c-type cytochrome [Chitinophagaceae bacterium]